MSDLGIIGAVALGIIVGMGVAGAAVARWFGPSLRKASHLVDDLMGEEARSGKSRTPGVVEQVGTLQTGQEEIKAEVGTLRIRQEEIGTIAQNAAADVAAVRTELTRNGGTSTKDAAYQAARSAEAAAAAAELACQTAARIESKLERHMQNGLDIMAVGEHNDVQVLAAIESLGGQVSDYRPFPPVDIGDDNP